MEDMRDVETTTAHPERCTKRRAQIVETNVKCLLSPQREGQYTAGIASRSTALLGDSKTRQCNINILTPFNFLFFGVFLG